jgi:WD40 repeat protein
LDGGRRKKEEGGRRRKEEGRMRKEEGGRRKEAGGRRKEESLTSLSETLLCTFIGHTSRVNDIRLKKILDSDSGDPGENKYENMIASVGADKTVRVWDMRTRQCEITWEGHEDEVTCLDWTGTFLFSLLSLSSLLPPSSRTLSPFSSLFLLPLPSS